MQNQRRHKLCLTIKWKLIYAGWVCCCFLSLLQVLRFPSIWTQNLNPILNSNSSKFQFYPESVGHGFVSFISCKSVNCIFKTKLKKNPTTFDPGDFEIVFFPFTPVQGWNFIAMVKMIMMKKSKKKIIIIILYNLDAHRCQCETEIFVTFQPNP